MVNAERLFEEHYDELVRYLLRLTGDSDAAADAAQETFVRLVEHQPNGEQIRGWLYRVATNYVRDDARVSRRRAELLREVPDRAPTPEALPSPHRLLESAEKKRLVRRALDGLSDKDQTVLMMREQGFSHHEIADAVGTTTKSVGSMIARALKKLSTELARHTENEP